MKTSSAAEAVVTRRGAILVAFALSLAILFNPAAPPAVVSAAVQTERTEAELWLAPIGVTVPLLGGAAGALAVGNARAALPVFQQAVNHPVLGPYARLYQGRAELVLGQVEAAAQSAQKVLSGSHGGALAEQARWLLADAREQAAKWPEAAKVLRELAQTPNARPANAYLRFARASYKAEVPADAALALARVYLDYPLSSEAAEAESDLRRYFQFPPASQTFESATRRAETLFAARRYEDARKAFDSLWASASAEDRPRIDLRVAQCDVYLKRYGPARNRLMAYFAPTFKRFDEARYFDLTAAQGLKLEAEYQKLVRQLVDLAPASPYTENALNDLATRYILANDDEKANDVFREMFRLFPTGAYGDRAAWRSGWWAYRHRDYAETIRIFEAAAANYPRADYRSAWLYWAARSYQKQGRLDGAVASYQRTIASYRNSYYGREAARELARIPVRTSARVSGPGPSVDAGALSAVTIPTGPRPPSARLIQSLLAAGLYDDAMAEIRQTERELGTSPFLQATTAYALNKKGELRSAITTMRRAYPQFMADGGELLPLSLLKVIFPIDHWELIRHHAIALNLDPYLMAALVAQESTFQADIKSSANAWGLMQIVPPTGRMYATRLGIRRFTTARLTDPDLNVRIGTRMFSDLMKQFGDEATALAAYNAGENRAARWRAERPGIDRDEFIDDIPFPETQNYVKRILGTAEDYRLLYGGAQPQRAALRDVRESSR